MTTTKSLQLKKDYYDTLDECKEQRKNVIQTNSRYANFNQTHFTAGDVEQFETYRDESNGETFRKNISFEQNLFKDFKLYNNFAKYSNIDSAAVLNTFRYLFYKFKKGIFVKIQNNELKVFLPFSNANFHNEWNNLIKIDPKFKELNDFFAHISEMQGYKFKPQCVNGLIRSWYANNSLIRYEYPVYEGDTNVSVMKNMLEELCANRQVNDIEFFINRRDFPLITKGGYEAYYHLWGTREKPLVSHNYDKYCPIFSMSNTESFADILLPSYEDWIRVTGRCFLNASIKSYVYLDKMNTDWDSKKNIAVFRGSSTGCGITIETNMRLKVSHMSFKNVIDSDGVPLLDAGITKWNVRPRKIMENPYLQTIDITKLPFILKDSLTYEEQSDFKYIIHIDGHVTAFRLSNEMATSSLILMVKSEWKCWFSDMLEAYKHYVPVKHDLSDLYDKIKWCKNNDDKCKNIAKNAREFYDTYLCREGVLDYLQKLLVDVKKDNGDYIYNYTKPVDIIMDIESIALANDWNLDSENTYVSNDEIYDFFNYLEDDIKGLNENKFNEVVFSNKFGNVKKYIHSDIELKIKSANESKKIKELLHEAFIGKKFLNNLLKKIPTFIYTFNFFKTSPDTYNLVSEYINGPTLQEYINSCDFNSRDFLLIICQLCVALHIAQKDCSFVHNDMTPWNIILKHQKCKYEKYDINNNEWVNFNTSVVPFIIDYGKSHVIGGMHTKAESPALIHYGHVNPFKFETYRDICSLLITSVYEILNSKYMSTSNKTDILCFKLLNYLSGSEFRKTPFNTTKDTIGFLKTHKKYTNLVNEKPGLEDRTPGGLYNYILKEFSEYKLGLKPITGHIPSSSKYKNFDEGVFDDVNKVSKLIMDKDIDIVDLNTVKAICSNMYSENIKRLEKIINNDGRINVTIIKQINAYKDVLNGPLAPLRARAELVGGRIG